MDDDADQCSNSPAQLQGNRTKSGPIMSDSSSAEPERLKPDPDQQMLQNGTSLVNCQSEETQTSDPMQIDPPPWKGWAELENDPIIFTTILHTWGVEDVQVNEVIPLDAILEKEPSSILGLIFLSRWMPSEDSSETTEHPTDLWFANQISTFSCATLALMNIINNRNDVTLGNELQDFKTRTVHMSPKERGLELDKFQFLKDIHNSFSRELDRMHVDLRLKDEVQAAARKSKKRRKKLTTRKKKRYLDDEDENGFHFVAYVPAQGHVWRLDGMESHPKDMGPVESDDTWLIKIIADLQEIMEVSEANEMEFSLLSLDHEPGKHQAKIEADRVTRMKEDWSPFIVHMLKLHAEKGDLQDLLGR